VHRESLYRHIAGRGRVGGGKWKWEGGGGRGRGKGGREEGRGEGGEGRGGRGRGKGGKRKGEEKEKETTILSVHQIHTVQDKIMNSFWMKTAQRGTDNPPIAGGGHSFS
jgi:hypothetical protein